MKTINQEDFTKSLFALFKETFESTNTAFGTMYLDQNTGFFATLEQVDAEKASRAVSDGTPPAAQPAPPANAMPAASAPGAVAPGP